MIFSGTGQTNTLTLYYLLGITYKSAHSSATLESLKLTRSTKLLEVMVLSHTQKLQSEHNCSVLRGYKISAKIQMHKLHQQEMNG